MQARKIPEVNLIQLPMPLDEEVAGGVFPYVDPKPVFCRAFWKKVSWRANSTRKRMLSVAKSTVRLFNSAKYLTLRRGTPLRVAK